MSAPVVVARWDSTVPELVRIMRRHSIKGIPIVDGFGLLCGIVTESNILANGAVGHSCTARMSDDDETPPNLHVVGPRADEIMTTGVITADACTSAHDIARLMVKHAVNRIPITNGEELLGIVTRADILALFDRNPYELIADVRTALRNEVGVDPDRLEIVVVNGVVRISGWAENADLGALIEDVVARIDGVSAIDISGLRGSGRVTA
jgi:CBS domain-containing protein